MSCQYKSITFPNITPIIYSLSINSSIENVYTRIEVYGDYFSSNSIVQFGGYSCPITFQGSTYIVFTVPQKASPSKYSVTVVTQNLVSNSFDFIVSKFGFTTL
jgi:hypothetical protein